MRTRPYCYYVEYVDADSHACKIYYRNFFCSKDAERMAEIIKKEGHICVSISYRPEIVDRRGFPVRYDRDSYKRDND